MRRYDRRPAPLAITVRAAESRVEGGLHMDTTDASEGGAFIRADLLFEVGEELRLEIPLLSGEIVMAIGRVVRVSRGSGFNEHPGMGIQFMRLTAKERRAIAASLRGQSDG